MNRKLHNTILAFSVTGVMLFVGLVVAEPALPTRESAAAQPVPAIAADQPEADAPAPSTGEAADTPPAAQANDTEAAVAMAAGLLAASVADAVLTAVFAELEPSIAQSRLERDPPSADTRPGPGRGTRASRDTIAVPYFSFARGSRASRS